jgi:hypothetical protein
VPYLKGVVLLATERTLAVPCYGMVSGSKNRHTQHRGDLSINRGERQCGLGSVQNTDEILADCERVVARWHLNPHFSSASLPRSGAARHGLHRPGRAPFVHRRGSRRLSAGANGPHRRSQWLALSRYIGRPASGIVSTTPSLSHQADRTFIVMTCHCIGVQSRSWLPLPTWAR